jgi:TRAP-type C4-dicarboxylate transport system substrate-binding protein
MAARTGGRVTVNPMPDAKSGLRTRDQLKAVTEGKFAMADSFGGALGDDSPVFLLSSLPFVTPSMADARVLFELALPLYEKLFAERRQKLLYVVPWPPSGIWSAIPVTSIDALKSLKIRTYDKTSTDVLSRIAASATIVSFSDLNPKLEAGDINAVLSSGDGGAGRQLWKFVRQFSAINYAAPLSFVSISLSAWDGLDDASRAAMEEAARETTERQWTVLATRLDENFARMRQNGVAIDDKPPAEVMSALRVAADASIADWLTRAGPDATQVYDTYRKARR